MVVVMVTAVGINSGIGKKTNKRLRVIRELLEV